MKASHDSWVIFLPQPNQSPALMCFSFIFWQLRFHKINVVTDWPFHAANVLSAVFPNSETH